jgi:hypothetical protein
MGATPGAANPLDPDPTAPEISSHPSSRVALEGWVVNLSVTASGTAPLAYQWLKDGDPIPGAIAAGLSLGPVSQDEAGEYSVRVSNDAGVAISNPAAVTVLVPPEVGSVLETGPGGRTLVLSLPVHPALVYEVSESSDLGEWTVIQTIVGQSGVVQIERAVPADGERHFYRVGIRP